MSTVKVLVTGAAGQIGYSLCQMIASGAVFGDKQPLELVLLDIPVMKDVMEGVVMELRDCAYHLLRNVAATSSEEEAFKDIDAAFLVGAMPRKEGMERKDLLAANVKIFKSQGQALDKFAKKTVKVLVVGNPANTNAFITSKYAPSIPAKNISAMTRLDHNRTIAQVAMKSGVPVENVKNVTIWGNHSATQFPDVAHATVIRDGKSIDAVTAVNDKAWLEGPFIPLIQKRGAEIIKMRKLSSAMSAAKAACDHMHDWFHGTPAGTHVSMAVVSDGSYGIPNGIVYSFPVTINASTKEWTVVTGLPISDFAKGKMEASLKELEGEKADALAACA